MSNRADVAKLADVSVATVTNVLTGRKLVGGELKDRVYRAAEVLQYIPDSSAQRLASGKNKHIGVAVSEPSNPYHSEIFKGIEAYAAERDYAVSTFNLDSNIQHKFKLIASRRLGGVVNLVSSQYPAEYVRHFIRHGVVMVNFECGESFRIDLDYTAAMSALVRKAAELGHRRAAFLSGLAGKYLFLDDRARVFRDLRAECGYESDDSLFATNDDLIQLTSEELGYFFTKRLIEAGKRFTVVFCINDMTALGAMKALRENGLRVPEDVSVTGCDDIGIGKYMYPPLTTLSFDKFAHGTTIAQRIIDKIEHPDLPYTAETVTLIPVYRESLTRARI